MKLDDSNHDSESDLEGPLDQDKEVLLEEEERERLLSRGLFGVGGGESVRIGKHVKGGRRGPFARAPSSEEAEEELLSPGSEEYKEAYDGITAVRKPRTPAVRTVLLLSFLLLALLLILIFGSLEVSLHSSTTAPIRPLLSNGSHPYFPTTILISLDGFRPDFLGRHLTPVLDSFARSGAAAAYMKPSFPSVTFPNHWTLATGLYPESHGIVGNTFWDPKLQRDFYYTDPARSLQSEWWGGEPIWHTAERQGVKAAVHMWPGSEIPADKTEFAPSYFDPFKKDEKLEVKVDRVLTWLDMDIDSRPQLILSYVPDVDVAGHKFGPNTTEIDNVVSKVDGMFGALLDGLEARNLTDIVNIIVVSDHGMASTDKTRLIHLKDILPDLSRIEHKDGWPLYGLRPKQGVNLSDLHSDLLKAHALQPAIHSPFHDTPVKPWSVFLRDVDMPSRWHFSNNERIAPLWIVPETGWAIVTEEDFPGEGNDYHPRGLHGYDNDHPLMRAIFIAKGPEFVAKGFHHSNRIQDKSDARKLHRRSSSVLQPFTNTEVYGIVCDSIGIAPAPYNGTLKGIAGLQRVPEPIETANLQITTSAEKIPSSTSSETKMMEKTSPTPVESSSPETTTSNPNAATPTDLAPGDEAHSSKIDRWWKKIKYKAQKIADGVEHWWQRVWTEGDKEE